MVNLHLKTLNRMNDLEDGVKVTGRIRLDGVRVPYKEMDSITLRHRVGMVFQQPNPFPKSIYDNVSLWTKNSWYSQKKPIR